MFIYKRKRLHAAILLICLLSAVILSLCSCSFTKRITLEQHPDGQGQVITIDTNGNLELQALKKGL